MHGYMHGYEQGFHAADLDLQMTHDPADPTQMKAYRSLTGYESAFGDKHFFENGYHKGFVVGYADGMSERQFRAEGELRALAQALPDGDDKPSKVFDTGFSAGYGDGVQHGLRDGRVGMAFMETGAECQEGYLGSSRRGDEYCSGYLRGYRLGYNDGYVNQAPQVLAERK